MIEIHGDLTAGSEDALMEAYAQATEGEVAGCACSTSAASST